MDFEYSPKVLELQAKLTKFMQERVLPAEAIAEQQLASKPDHWGAPPIVADLKAAAKREGLWNLFLPAREGAGLTNLEYAPLAELTGWSPLIAPEVVNCNPPDTGNMELLHLYGTDEQKQQWLEPLLAGEFRLCFSMTEPEVASSDANNVRLEIAEDGDDWVLTGRKWWSTAALRHDCRVAMVMGVTDPEAVGHDEPGEDRVGAEFGEGHRAAHDGLCSCYSLWQVAMSVRVRRAGRSSRVGALTGILGSKRGVGSTRSPTTRMRRLRDLPDILGIGGWCA